MSTQDHRWPDHRWQDFVISPRRTSVEMIFILLIALLLGFASVGGNGDGKHFPAPSGVRPPLVAEQAPSLAKAAKPRVIPKGNDDWLDRREITGQ
jgi:hypothetical protein